jgi:glycosyltransferase involved in cell wall biosynthesis
MEYGSAMVTRNKFSQKVNDYFYERFTFKLVDAALPISEVLKNLILNVNRDLPVLKTPVLVDMNCFQKDLPKWDYKYFLFCGAAAFIEIIDFIIKSFELVSSKDIKLHLNCFGSPKEIMTLNDRISRSDKSKLIIFTSKLKYNDLINHYKSAIALLIPLRPTLQDKARFPHKIGEYAASGRPIISNNIGEMAYYFIDGKSALLADSYEFESFRDKMNFVINYPKEADRIGNEGRSVAEENFSYKMFGKGLREFLINIKN